jgi:hypothetical protein
MRREVQIGKTMKEETGACFAEWRNCTVADGRWVWPKPCVCAKQGVIAVDLALLSQRKMAATLPKDISKLGSEVKLFGKWDTQESVSFYPELCPY